MEGTNHLMWHDGGDVWLWCLCVNVAFIEIYLLCIGYKNHFFIKVAPAKSFFLLFSTSSLSICEVYSWVIRDVINSFIDMVAKSLASSITVTWDVIPLDGKVEVSSLVPPSKCTCQDP